MSSEQQSLPDHLKRFHFTIVGGFAHGWRIPYSNGLQRLQFAQEGQRLHEMYDHISHIFRIEQTGAYLVVFAPIKLPSDLAADFLKGKVSEEYMKSFSVEKGVFEVSGVGSDL